MKLGIVGGGVVGKATARAFLGYGNHEVRVYDVVPERATHSLNDVLECDMIFVCLPTPMKSNGSCDTSALDMFFGEREDGAYKNSYYVIRSTVPIRYCRAVSRRSYIPFIAHWPEFLTARCADTDAKIPARNVIGSDEGSLTCPVARSLHRLCNERWPGVPTFNVTYEVSALVKLAQNAYSAIKITFFNELYDLCEKIGADFSIMREALLAGGWIEPMHTQVPGPDGKRGFGGACLPKDTASLVVCATDDEVLMSMASMAMLKNDSYAALRGR